MAYSLANVLNQEHLKIWAWKEDGVFVAKCLDIPGCVSEGATRDEAVTNISDAISQCLAVIQQDAAKSKTPGGPGDVEMIERPVREFLRAN